MDRIKENSKAAFDQQAAVYDKDIRGPHWCWETANFFPSRTIFLMLYTVMILSIIIRPRKRY